jgi:AsmA protein
MGIDRLNVDRYRTASSAPSGTASTGAPKAASGTGGAAADAIDLSALKNLNLNGQLRAVQLTASGVKIDKLQAGVRAAAGRLDINPISAALYGGALAGSASADQAKGNHFSVKQQLTGVNIGPLLRDLANKDMLEGRGNVTLDLQASGATVTALKHGLDGTANLKMTDGAIKGINLAESFRKARSMLGAKTQEQAANKADKTDFTELSASFVIRGGIARNDDLAAKSPFLRLGGAGTIDIGASQVDYLAKVSLVNTSGGQGAKDLGDMRGLTIPVRLSGPFDALKYRIDFAAAATDAVKQQVQESVKEKVQDKLQDRLKGLFRR